MKATASSAVNKYLRRYAAAETRLLAGPANPWPDHCHYDYVLVIPAYKESSAFYHRLRNTLMRTSSALVIIVINQPDRQVGIHPQNEALRRDILTTTSCVWEKDLLQLRTPEHCDSAVLIVDRCSSSPIPHKQGVGLARKIGADVALTLINHQHIKQPWIYCSDADTHLPAGYFDALTDKSAAAAVYPFQHLCGDDPIGRATELYEQRMRQYVRGLRAAGSPYAYHALGSALAVDGTAYAQVRGFPKRNGGEDFYLLNKVAKVGSILNLAQPELCIDARQSDRVPFGTGPAINRLLSEQGFDQAAIFYHPDTFTHLREWLAQMPDSWGQAIADLPLPDETLQALYTLGTLPAAETARQISKTRAAYVRHMHNWFDALKTLRFIHLLRDGGLANVTLAALPGGP